MFLGLQKTNENNLQSRLKIRSEMLKRSRDFFHERNVIEVDVPALSPYGSIDPFIDLVQVFCCSEIYYLHSSPEYGMKKLLSQGSGDIFQISHVFRDNEKGDIHSPEFTLTEWYRIGFTFQQMIQESIDYIQLFTGLQEVETFTYDQAFKKFLNIDPHTVDSSELLQLCVDLHIPLYEGCENKENLLNLLLESAIEPNFNPEKITVFMHYPPHEAALAKIDTDENNRPVAKRFELYYKSLELANGYEELTDAQEQKERLIQAQEKRELLGKLRYPIDEEFLNSLQKGMPDCCGVAVGFDRLMLLIEKQNIENN